MSVDTLLEIAFGKPESLTRVPQGGLIRVIPAGPNHFRTLEADPEALTKARQAGQSFNWIRATESKPLTAEEVGQKITDILRNRVG